MTGTLREETTRRTAVVTAVAAPRRASPNGGPAPRAKRPTAVGAADAGAATEEPVGCAPVPAANRIVNYWLGGFRNFAADRELAHRLTAVAPCLPAAVRLARHYRRQILHRACADGLTQILEFGAGIPLSDADLFPGLVDGREVRAAYIDNDPLAVAGLTHCVRRRAPWIIAVNADLRIPEALLDLLVDRNFLDPTVPVLALLPLVLHHLSDFHALHLLSVLHTRLPPGSRLMITSLVADTASPDQRDALTAAYTATPELILRTGPQTVSLLRRTGWPCHDIGDTAGLHAALLTREPVCVH